MDVDEQPVITTTDRQLMREMTKSDAREWLDAKERELARAILDIRTLRNRLSAVHQLPPEILIDVFWTLAQEGWESQHGRTSAWLDWTVVARVCCTWRLVALGAAKLWSHIHMRADNPASVDAFLHRSGSTPLYLVIQGASASREGLSRLLSSLTGHSYRISSFEMVFRREAFDAVSQYLAETQMPALEALSIAQWGPSRRIFPPTHSLVVDTVLDQSRSTLRRVYLEYVSIPWSTMFLNCHLTHLELRYQNPGESRAMEEFISALQEWRNLDTLVLVAAGPLLPASTLTYPDPTVIVDLPFLTTLTLSDSRPLDITHLLSHLHTSASCVIRISCDVEDAAYNIFPRDCSLLEGMNVLQWLHVQVDDESSIFFSGGIAPDVPLLSITCATPGVDPGFLQSALLFNLPSFLNLSHVREVDIVHDGTPNIGIEKCAMFFDALPNLTCLSGSTSTELSDILIRSLQQQPSKGDDILCLCLEELEIPQATNHELAEFCDFRSNLNAPLRRVYPPPQSHMLNADTTRV